MKSISILGTGWLGLPLAHYFLALGYHVKGSTRSKERIAMLESAGIDPFLVDVDTLKDPVLDFLQSSTLIVNIPSKNLAGFSVLVNAIKQSDIQNVLFVSSTSVYENCNKTVTESDVDSYSKSPLLDIERLFMSYGKVKTTILRLGGLIGYSRQPGRFFRSGKRVPSANSPVNLIHRDDCIGIIARIIEREAWGEVYNGCADTHPTKRDFYSLAALSIGEAIPNFLDSDSDAKTYKIVSNEKVKRSLSYAFKYPDLMKIEFSEDK